MPDGYYSFNALTFVWDEDKNRKNILKHGIDFKTLANRLERNAYNNNIIGRY